jgi:hypothetical protein
MRLPVREHSIEFCHHECFKTEGENVDSSILDNINITRLLKAISVSLFILLLWASAMLHPSMTLELDYYKLSFII